MEETDLFEDLHPERLPTFHEIRSLSSHLYARSGYETREVQNLMAHTDPDMTRAYQRGHARKLLQVDMMLPFDILQFPHTGKDSEGGTVRELRGAYRISAA